MADQRRLVEGHADLVSTYPNDPAAPDHAISLGHQLKPKRRLFRSADRAQAVGYGTSLSTGLQSKFKAKVASAKIAQPTSP
jgi:hypothetical protein